MLSTKEIIYLSLEPPKTVQKKLNVKAETIYYYTTGAYKRKLEKRKNPEQCRTAIVLE